MNYQNIFPSLQTHYFYQIPLLQYSFTQVCYLYPSQVQNIQSISPQHLEVKQEINSKKNSFAQIEQKLKEMHMTNSQHRKLHWSINEDQLLQRLVQIQKLQWKQLPEYFPNRSQNMCYSRYRRIAMGAKDRIWNKSQQQMVLDLVDQYGEKWKLIHKKMPKFTPKQIREKYLNCLRPTISKQNFTLQEDIKICKFIAQHGKHWRKMEEVLPGRSEGCIKGRFYSKLNKVILGKS